jgi:hypothetical protein
MQLFTIIIPTQICENLGPIKRKLVLKLKYLLLLHILDENEICLNCLMHPSKPY